MLCITWTGDCKYTWVSSVHPVPPLWWCAIRENHEPLIRLITELSVIYQPQLSSFYHLWGRLIVHQTVKSNVDAQTPDNLMTWISHCAGQKEFGVKVQHTIIHHTSAPSFILVTTSTCSVSSIDWSLSQTRSNQLCDCSSESQQSTLHMHQQAQHIFPLHV